MSCRVCIGLDILQGALILATLGYIVYEWRLMVWIFTDKYPGGYLNRCRKKGRLV